MTKLVFPEIFEEFKVPESEFINDPLKKKRELTDDEIYVESMQLIQMKMPRIHKLIELTWGDKKEFDTWIDKIWLDDRGDRQGFPADVMSALHKLHTIHIKRFGTVIKKNDIWTANRKFF